MRRDVIWAVVLKDLIEFRRNRFILYSLVMFPLFVAVFMPLTTIAPFVFTGSFGEDVTPPPHLEPDTEAVLNQSGLDSMTANLSENETLMLKGYHIIDTELHGVVIVRCHLEGSVVVHSIIQSSRLESVTARHSSINSSSLEDCLISSGSMRDSWGWNVTITSTVLTSNNEIRDLKDPSALDPSDIEDIVISTLMLVFIILPAVTPTVIASFSLIGEKKSKSLEPILACPIRDLELLIGKILASYIPTQISVLGAFGLFVTMMQFLSVDAFGYNLAFHPSMLLAVFFIAPLVALLSIEANVIISSRMNDVRAAQQTGALVTLPLILFFLIPLFTLTSVDPLLIIPFGLVIAIVDILLIKLNEKIFHRENILVKWS